MNSCAPSKIQNQLSKKSTNRIGGIGFLRSFPHMSTISQVLRDFQHDVVIITLARRWTDKLGSWLAWRTNRKNMHANRFVKLCWHGNTLRLVAAEENFRRMKKMDAGYFGGGTYFTQYPSYGDYYIQERKQTRNVINNDIPLILSWIMLGKAYPVRIHDIQIICWFAEK